MGSNGAARGLGRLSWVRTAERALVRHSLAEYWQEPERCANMESTEWAELVEANVDDVADTEREARMAATPSGRAYTPLKAWGANPRRYSMYRGEEGRIGQRVIERYLDDRTALKGTRLKLLCRLGTLPLMRRVGREVHPPWPVDQRLCCACDQVAVEDTHHFLMVCPSNDGPRAKIMSKVAKTLTHHPGGLTTGEFQSMSTERQLRIILGTRFDNRTAEDRIDHHAKIFITSCWHNREPVTRIINDKLGVSY